MTGYPYPLECNSGEPETAGSFAEHTCVRAMVPIVEGKHKVPVGSTGTIVHVYSKVDAFEVEFTEPVHVIVGARRNEIEPV